MITTGRDLKDVELEKTKEYLESKITEILFYNWDKRLDTNKTVVYQLMAQFRKMAEEIIGDIEPQTNVHDKEEMCLNNFATTIRNNLKSQQLSKLQRFFDEK